MKKPTAQDWNNRMAEIADRYIHQEQYTPIATL